MFAFNIFPYPHNLEKYIFSSISDVNGSPPPLPPHGIPIIDPDYRPPVPPHRNVGVSTNANVESMVSHFNKISHKKIYKMQVR